ncbi:MAG: copper resistance protein, partial [Xanthobacteraceae bacterium]|nr:copper resistance protein [Xanthobacteraceae bacterium]
MHFAATAMMVGNIVFGTLIAMPVLRSEPTRAAALRVHLTRLSWFGLAIAVISGAIWLMLQAASMSGLPLDEALTADVLSTVVTESQFGEVTALRACIAVCLAILLACDRA